MTEMLFTLELPRGITGKLVSEGAREVVFEEGAKRHRFPSHTVTRVLRVDDPRERELTILDALVGHGDFQEVERRATEVLAGKDVPAWVAARAAGAAASARLLRARLAPRACLGTGDAALLAGRHDRATEAFTRLVEGDFSALPPWRYLGRLGLLRVRIAKGDREGALPGLIQLEKDNETDAFAGEAAMNARIIRAETLAALRRDGEAAVLLEAVRDDPMWTSSPLIPRLLNALAGIYLTMNGKRPDGTWKPEGVLLGLPLRLRVVRYGHADIVERSRALAAAAHGLRMVGQEEVAEMIATELGTRFPAAESRELAPAGRGLGE